MRQQPDAAELNIPNLETTSDMETMSAEIRDEDVTPNQEYQCQFKCDIVTLDINLRILKSQS